MLDNGEQLPPPEESLGYLIHKTFVKAGIAPHLTGFRFLCEAVMMLFENEANIYGVTKNMYPTIAKKYYSTPSRVERAVRHAIEIAWENREVSSTQKYFPVENMKPTNSQFIAYMYVEISHDFFSDKINFTASQDLYF